MQTIKLVYFDFYSIENNKVGFNWLFSSVLFKLEIVLIEMHFWGDTVYQHNNIFRDNFRLNEKKIFLQFLSDDFGLFSWIVIILLWNIWKFWK